MRRVVLALALMLAAVGAAPAAAQDPGPPPVPPPPVQPLTTVRAEAISAVLDVRVLLSNKTISAEELEATRNACETLPSDDLLLVRYYNLCQGYVDLVDAEQDFRDCFAINVCRRTISNYRKRLRYYRTVALKFNDVLPTEVPAPACAAALSVDRKERGAIKKLDRNLGRLAKGLGSASDDRLKSLFRSVRAVKGFPSDKQLRTRFRAACR